MSMIDTALKTLLIGSAVGVTLGGCSTVGPVSIDQARTPYNQVIQNTSEQQTLLNIVRVHDAETPLFMDVTEVDAVTTAHVEITGTESGFGSFQKATSTSGPMGGAMGSVGGTASYEESPTVRYQPLLGAALVAQVNTPVNTTSLVNLYNSGWSLGSIFDLTVARFTPGFDDYHAALNALMTLDRYGALVLEAKPRERKPPAEMKSARVSVSMGQPPDKGDADLLIYFRPERLRSRFRGCDDGSITEVKKGRTGAEEQADDRLVTIAARNLWARVRKLIPSNDGVIVLSMKSESDGPGKIGKNHPISAAAPLLQTRSALGMLNTIAADDNLVLFTSKEQVDATIAGTPDRKGFCHASFYRRGDHDATGRPDYENRSFTSIDGAAKGPLDPGELKKERKSGDDRRLILVEVTTTRPADAFVSVSHRNNWYSIQQDDLISKRNLALVAQIATIQAVPPQTPPLTPSITVGGR